jgi:two-component system, NtrC family, sensor kinase
MQAIKLLKVKYQQAYTFLQKYARFRSSIYSRVVYIIIVFSFFLFLAFAVIFRSVNESYVKNIIHQNGNNIGYLVEGALYHSMLENDKSSLQNTLDIINKMPGIDEVNLYDGNDSLVYYSAGNDAEKQNIANCKTCHGDIDKMFPRNKKSYRIVDNENGCRMNASNNSGRHLFIKTPILNEKSCYTSNCHAHKPTDVVLGSLIINIPLNKLDSTLHKSTTDFFYLAALMTICLVVFLIFFTRRRIKKPLYALIKASEDVSNGDMSTRLEIPANQLDDMRMVSNAFNRMLDNLETATTELQNWSQQLEYKVQKKSEELGQVQSELINIEKIASLGKLSLSVAHEINNPLSGILVYTKLVSKQLTNIALDSEKKESMLKHLKLVENETKRCGDIVKGLLDFSRKDNNNFENKHLHETLRKTAELMAHPMKIANISFYTDFMAENDLVNCSPNQIKQACIAILVNAQEAVLENGEIIIRTCNPDNQHLIIDISDNGIGIAPDDIPHIFEPFFSTKQSEKGIGLGLAIVHGIIQSHNGKITVKSEPGKGTTFSLLLPLSIHN